MTVDQEVNDFLKTGGGPPSYFTKDSPIGATLKGTITNAAVAPVTDIKTGEVKLFKDGNKMKQLVLTILNDDDQQEYRWFLKPQAKALLFEKVKAAGAEGIEIGARCAGKFAGTEPSDQPGLDPKKIFDVDYAPPKPATISSGDLL